MSKEQDQLNVLERTIQECEAMLRFARAKGKAVKPELQSTIEKIRIQREQIRYEMARKREEEAERVKNKIASQRNIPVDKVSVAEIEKQIKSRPRSLSEFSEPVEPGEPSEEDLIKDLGKVHQELAGAVFPALPSAVVVLEEGQKSSWKFLGPIPLVRRMMFITLFCLAGFLALFLSPMVDSQTVASNILNMDNWMQFALNESVIVLAAALGAAFYALFEAYKYVANGSYDPRYESIYWIRFTLGIVSGVILAQFIFQPGIDPDTILLIQEMTAEELSAIKTATIDQLQGLIQKYGLDALELENLRKFTPDVNNAAGAANLQGLFTYSPLLSFLGGFSARVVHKILNSLVDSVESFISGSARDLIRAREESAKAQLEEKVSAIKQQTVAKEAANRLQSAMQLMQLQQQISAGMSNDALKSKLENMIDNIVQPVGGEGIFNSETPTVPVASNQDYNPYATNQGGSDNNSNASGTGLGDVSEYGAFGMGEMNRADDEDSDDEGGNPDDNKPV